MAKILVVFFAVLICGVLVECEDKNEINHQTVEEGRTLVHHAMKRLSILLPAFMFKLGIMFTMILVSMITSTKGLLVGTLLLALGIGHFIATKFSAVSSTPLAHYIPAHSHLHALPVPHALSVHHPVAVPHTVPVGHAQWLDRSDNVQGSSNVGTLPSSYQGYGQYGQYGNAQAYSSWKQ